MCFSRKNYKVKLSGRGILVYIEGGRAMKIGAEMTSDSGCDMFVYLDSLKQWQPPHDKIPVTREDQLRIKTNILKDLKGFRIDWV